jgi:hypothetical protein
MLNSRRNGLFNKVVVAGRYIYPLGAERGIRPTAKIVNVIRQAAFSVEACLGTDTIAADWLPLRVYAQQRHVVRSAAQLAGAEIETDGDTEDSHQHFSHYNWGLAITYKDRTETITAAL